MQPGQFLVKGDEKIKLLEVFKNTVVFEQDHEIISFFPDGKKEFNTIIKTEIESIEKLNYNGWSPLEEPWNPGEDDAYWYVNFDGEIRRTEYRNWLVPSDEGHNFRLKIGNVHRTYEDAEAYKQKLIERMVNKEYI